MSKSYILHHNGLLIYIDVDRKHLLVILLYFKFKVTYIVVNSVSDFTPLWVYPLVYIKEMIYL